MRRSGRHLPSLLVPCIVIFSLIWAVVFALDLLPILRGGFGWQWNLKPELSRYRVMPLALGLP